MLEKYCTDAGVDASRHTLCWDGENVNVDEETPNTLDMDDDDVIDVVAK